MPVAPAATPTATARSLASRASRWFKSSMADATLAALRSYRAASVDALLTPRVLFAPHWPFLLPTWKVAGTCLVATQPLSEWLTASARMPPTGGNPTNTLPTVLITPGSILLGMTIVSNPGCICAKCRAYWYAVDRGSGSVPGPALGPGPGSVEESRCCCIDLESAKPLPMGQREGAPAPSGGGGRNSDSFANSLALSVCSGISTL
jgi:hypothetical protein